MYRWIGLVQLQSHVLLSCRGFSFSFSFTFRFSGSLSLLPDLIFILSSLPVTISSLFTLLKNLLSVVSYFPTTLTNKLDLFSLIIASFRSRFSFFCEIRLESHPV